MTVITSAIGGLLLSLEILKKKLHFFPQMLHYLYYVCLEAVMKHLNLGFVGFGLIGGSIARALRKDGADISIYVYSRRHNPELEQGVKEGVIDEIWYKIDERFACCDIVFLCAPVLKNIEYLPVMKKWIKPDCLLTDVGSVKGNICQAALKEGLGSQFIGGHPMAGSEKTGYANSTDTLLENAYYLLTPTKENRPEDIALMQEIVGKTRANCVVLDYHHHDQITAAISHVPHILAVSLVNMVRKNDNDAEDMKSFAAGGFKDITRIASSSPAMWQDICIANGESIDHFLQYYIESLEEFRRLIAQSDMKQIYREFEEAGNYRNSMSVKKKGSISSSYELFVNIDDEPGAIAVISSLLFGKKISIKNIGIIHNREYADGVLRIEFYSEAARLSAKDTLEKYGLDLPARD